MRSIARALGHSWPLSLADINKHKVMVEAKDSNEWARCVSQGHGAAKFHDDPMNNV